MKKYKEGMIVVGRVTGIKDYGIFVMLDNYHTGLVHISKVANKHIDDLHDYVDLNELIRVKIIKIFDNFFELSLKNVDYRIMKRNKSKIKETEEGFANLALHLDYWVFKDYNLQKK